MSRKAYPTDVSDVEWDLIKSMIPAQRQPSSWKKASSRYAGGSKCDLLRIACRLLIIL